MPPPASGQVRWCRSFAALSCAWLLTACTPCAQGPCEAAREPQAARGIEQGVTGVVASRTDACVDGCCACSWSSGVLRIWTAPEAISDAQAALDLVSDTSPADRFMAERSYERALDTGHYLICHDNTCAAVDLEDGDVITVNVQQVYGPPQLNLFGPRDRAPHPERVFDVGE